MKTLIAALLVSVCAWGAIGDNAPSIPTGYVSAHPRLGAPDNTYLGNVWTNRAGTSKYIFDNATAFDPAHPETGGITLAKSKCRHLLIAYLASKVGGSPDAGYLAKIVSLAAPTGTWDLSTQSRWDPSICMALAYDWVYSDLDSTTRSTYLSNLQMMLADFETTYVSSSQSPVGDQFYLTGTRQVPFLMLALDVYPDGGSTGLAHLRWASDVWMNLVIPMWKKVMTGGRCQSASTDSDIDCGAGWHEPWQSYFAQVGQPSQNQWYVMNNLAWKNATGDDIFTRESWLKNIAYWTMYQTRPDMLQVKASGTYTTAYTTQEYDGATYGMAWRPGVLGELGAIYNDPTIRGWNRKVNWRNTTPPVWEPSAWPWYPPDTSATVNTRSSLSKVRNFPGWGVLYFRTGWGEDDTLVTLEYGDLYWSHPIFGTGSFTIYNRGQLALNSGNYKPGSDAPHWWNWASQTIAHNSILVKNSSESFPAESNYKFQHSDGSTTFEVLQNDGGQVRNGSEFNISNGSITLGPVSPASPGDLDRDREWYHRAKLVGYAVGTGNKYSAAMVDMTAAYNNMWSRVAHQDYNKYTSNTDNRTFRVQKAVRYLVFIPRGTSAYVVTYDQVISVDPSYTKTWLLHSVNQPAVTGNAYTVTRNETTTDRVNPPLGWEQYHSDITHCPGGCTSGSTQYTYDGKLYGWMSNPTGGTLNTIGGTNNEFNVNGTNWNECMSGLCPTGIGITNTAGVIQSIPTDMPYEPGGWRLEETMDAARNSDNIVNVMLATNTGDTNTVSTAPVTTVVGTNLVTVWKDNSNNCTYTLTLPQDGIGGHLTIAGTCVGSQTVDADLLSTQPGTSIPANSWTHVNSTGDIIGQVTGNVDQCLYVPALTSMACLDNYRGTSSEPNLNWFLYNLDENKVSLASDISKFQSLYWSEGGHPTGLAVDPTSSIAYGFMAHSGGQVSDMSKTTVAFDFIGRVGKNKRTPVEPSYNATQMHCEWNTFARKLVCWGGDSSPSGLNLSYYDPATNAWSLNVSTTGTCPHIGLQVPMMALNTFDHKMYLFGGRFSSTYYSDLFSIDTTQSPAVCTQLTPTGGPPAARIWGGFAYDQARNKFVLTGGSTNGDSSFVTGAVYDTWVYDPIANTWTDITSTVGTIGSAPLAGPEYRFHYAPELDAFIMLPPDGAQTSNQPTWFNFLRLAPGAPIGGLSLTHSETPGGYNHETGRWAANGWVTADNSHVYAGFTQYGNVVEGNNASPLHPYVQEISTGTATSVPPGATYQSLSPDQSGAPLDSVDISMAMVAGVPWACWSEQGNSILARMMCKGYSGGSWSLGGDIGSTSYPGQSQIIDVGGKPTVIFRHNDRTSGAIPLPVIARVRQFSGGTWTELTPSGGLNQNGPPTIAPPLTTVALSVSATTDGGGTNIYGAWSEYTGATVSSPPSISYTNTKVYLKKWDGASWTLQCGGPANTNTSTGWAEGVSVAWYQGEPYVAFTERVTNSGAPRLFVRKCSGGSWVTVGGGSGYRNRDQSNGWAFKPHLITRTVSGSPVLDLVWDEQANTIPWATSEGLVGLENIAGEKSRIYASEWNGTTWTNLGGSPDADTAYGTATMPTLAAYNTSLVALWGETKLGSNRVMYAKAFNGTDWAPMGAGGGGGVAPTITTSSLPSAARNLTSYSQTLTATGDTPITWSIISGALPTGLSLNSGTGAITGTATGSVGTSSFTVQATNATGSDSKALSITVRNPNVPTDYADFQSGLTGIAALGCGNTLTVDAGTYTGAFTVPGTADCSNNHIVVQFNGPLAPAGVRITPNYYDKSGGPLMFTLHTNGTQPVLTFTDGNTPSRGWTFDGMYVTGSTNNTGAGMIYLGPTANNPTDNTKLPNSITFEHTIIRPNPTTDLNVRLISAHANNIIFKDSWARGGWCWNNGGCGDAQAISMNGGGLVTVDNSYLDGQTETIGIGGFGLPACYTPTGYPVNMISTGCYSSLVVKNSAFQHGLWMSLPGSCGFCFSWPTVTGSPIRFGQFYRSPAGYYFMAQNYGTNSATNENSIAWPTSVGATVTDGTVTWKCVSVFDGGSPAVAKNHIECKQCTRVDISNSYFKNAWSQGPQAQGYGWTLYQRTNQGPGLSAGPWTATGNIVENTASGIQVGGAIDDADLNTYPVLIASNPGPYVITTGVNDGITINGTTWTIPAGTYTAVQLADNINSHFNADTELSVSLTFTRDGTFGWHDLQFTSTGTHHFNAWIGDYAGSPMRFKGFTGSWAYLNDQLFWGAAQSGPDATWAWDDTHFNVRAQATPSCGSGCSLPNCPGGSCTNPPTSYGTVTVATGPIVAGIFPDPVTPTTTYLAIGHIGPMPTGSHVATGATGGIALDKSTTIQLSGTALATIGIAADSYPGCTHPLTHAWYGCGHPQGITLINNLFTKVAQTDNFLSTGALYVQGNIPTNISHNTIDYIKNMGVYFASPYNSGIVRSNLFYNTSKTDRFNTGINYIYENFDGNIGDMDAANHSICGAALTRTQYLSFWTPPIVTCTGAMSGNLFTGAWQAHILSGESGTAGVGFGTFPQSTMTPFASSVAFKPNSWRLASPSEKVTLTGTYNILGTSGTNTGNTDGTIDLGTKFFVDVDGQITKLRFYRSSACAVADVTAKLWGPTGTLLGSVLISGVAQGTWGEGTLSSPVSITASTNYTVSYHSTTGCYTTNLGSFGSQYDIFPLHVPANGGVFGATGSMPTSTSANGFGADVVFVPTGTISPSDSNCSVDALHGSHCLKGWQDYDDVGADTTKLPLIKNLQITYSDRAVIVSWLDSESQQNIPGVLRLCTDDPDYNPYCTPVGSITSADPVTQALSDNSDNDNSPKQGLQRYIVVTGLSSSTHYYGILERGGHTKTFDFVTLGTLSGTTSTSVSRRALSSMGSVANMLVTTGTNYSRQTDALGGGTASGSVSCTAGNTCSTTISETYGQPLWWQAQMRDSGNTVLFSYPVVLWLPGGIQQNVP